MRRTLNIIEFVYPISIRRERVAPRQLLRPRPEPNPEPSIPLQSQPGQHTGANPQQPPNLNNGRAIADRLRTEHNSLENQILYDGVPQTRRVRRNHMVTNFEQNLGRLIRYVQSSIALVNPWIGRLQIYMIHAGQSTNEENENIAFIANEVNFGKS
jgi:hypothetical protein